MTTVAFNVLRSVFADVSIYGFDCLYLFTDNINAKKMLNIYQKYLLVSAEKFYGKK